ncbi:hypothetical protein DACRYDRAFT_20528 [Dacryopinax primogenitus]|uniref:Uncharacterized protein n=1 Tax=Dacryopinax primogenitus (strain DJM 731) TaxID=1858805 RepID=M5G863_DACPD|nr:uncharacterized protein DACRYDRAFT_20528 [Dacryopinax primogenitus]EJU04954.1 hypothetical protein DACRYDRAFT_20528 [Dacryopinax primogenitus]
MASINVENASILDKPHEYHVPSELPLGVRAYKMAELALRTLREEKLELGSARNHAAMEQGYTLARQAAEEVRVALLAKQEPGANLDINEQVRAAVDVLHRIATLSMDRRMAFRLQEAVEEFDREAHAESPTCGTHLRRLSSLTRRAEHPQSPKQEQ